MPQFRISATSTTPSATTMRKGKCTAPNVHVAITKLFQRYPQLAEGERLQVSVEVDAEEDLT